MGARINAAKEILEQALVERRETIQNAMLDAKLKEESLDVTLPGRGSGFGGLHPVSRTLERVEQIFHSLGFEVADGPEIETDFYNFTALNQPENHPARSMHDTFYLADGKHPLRTHTPIQVRYMESHKPPIRIIARPGIPRGFRCNTFADVSSGRRIVD
jgi:phenylalanyl-tRNA synthetase alpha chain